MAGAGGIGALAVDRKDRTDGAEANNTMGLLLGCTSNIRSEDMVELLRQGIAIGDDDDP